MIILWGFFEYFLLFPILYKKTCLSGEVYFYCHNHKFKKKQLPDTKQGLT